MYVLTCPMCGFKLQAPFVRVDAAPLCRGCQKRFQVKPEHSRRLAPGEEAPEAMPYAGRKAAESAAPSGQVDAAAAAATATDTALEDASSSPHLEELASVVTSRLDPILAAQQALEQAAHHAAGHAPEVYGELPQEHHEAVPETSPELHLPVAPAAYEAPPATSPAVARQLAARMARGRALRTALALTVVMTFVVAAIAVGVWYGMRGRPSDRDVAPPRPPATAGNASQPDTSAAPPPVPAAFERVAPRTLGQSEWVETDEPRSPVEPGGLIELENAPPAPMGEHVVFYARLKTPRPNMLYSASIQASLADKTNRVYARCQVNVVMLTGHEPQRVRILAPRKLYRPARFGGLDLVVSPGPSLEQPVVLEGANLEPVGAGTDTVVKLTAYNPAKQKLRAAYFVIEALDDTGQPLGQWLVDWARPVQPEQSLAIAAPAPLPAGKPVARWRLTAVGEPG